jgi:putative lipoprotein
MTGRIVAILYLGSAALIAACASSMAATKPATSATYQCGEQRLAAAFAGDDLTVKMGAAEFALRRVEAADGAKYASPADATTFFWDKGATALWSLRGVLSPECSRSRETGPTPAAYPSAALTGREWIVEEINNRRIVENSRVTLAFHEDGRVSGDSSCNQYTAPYMLSGERLSFGLAAVTRRACITGGLMEQEDRFLEIFAKIDRFEIDQAGALILQTADGRRIRARRS